MEGKRVSKLALESIYIYRLYAADTSQRQIVPRNVNRCNPHICPNLGHVMRFWQLNLD